MPTYDWKCNCGNIFEERKSFSDDSPATCIMCGEFTTTKVLSTFTVIDKTPKTLGTLSERNKANMGRYNYDDTVQKMANERQAVRTYCGKLPEGASVVEKNSSYRPPWRLDSPVADTKLLKASPEQLQRYIYTGKRPFGTN